MDIQTLKPFFLWCTIINGALLALVILGAVAAPEPGLSLQSRWFQVPPESLSIATYLFLGLFKIFWLVFNLVPYLALVIVGKKAAAAGGSRFTGQPGGQLA